MPAAAHTTPPRLSIQTVRFLPLCLANSSRNALGVTCGIPNHSYAHASSSSTISPSIRNSASVSDRLRNCQNRRLPFKCHHLLGPAHHLQRPYLTVGSACRRLRWAAGSESGATRLV